jgi:hypothetical protein
MQNGQTVDSGECLGLAETSRESGSEHHDAQ